MPTIKWVGSPNFNSGRGGRSILAIVNHITTGNYPGCLEWLQNPVAKASSTYLILKDGTILQLVMEGDTAWANGAANKPSWSLYDNTNPNRYTISIEHEALAGEGLTEDQYQATLWLHRELIAKYKLPIDTEHIIGHYRIDSVNRPNCPGPKFPWERLFRDLKREATAVNEVILFFSPGDITAALAASARRGNIGMFCRYGDPKAIPADVQNAKTKYVIGGPKTGLPGEVYISGDDAIDTMGDLYKAKNDGRLPQK